MELAHLSNSQLISLFRSIVAELNLRDLDAVYDAQEALKEELVKKREIENLINNSQKEAQEIIRKRELELQLEQQNKQKEQAAARLHKDWTTKKSFASRLIGFLPEKTVDYWINVWNGQNETRVYINDGEPFGKRTREVAVFYATGNAKKIPGALDLKVNVADEGGLKQLLLEITKIYKSVKFSMQQALAYNGEAN